MDVVIALLLALISAQLFVIIAKLARQGGINGLNRQTRSPKRKDRH